MRNMKGTGAEATRWTNVAALPANVQCVSSKLDVFASFFALNGLEGVLSVCDRCTTSPVVRCVVRLCWREALHKPAYQNLKAGAPAPQETARSTDIGPKSYRQRLQVPS